MNHTPYIYRKLGLILSLVFLAGCAGTQAELSATIEPKTCPTTEPQYCPPSEPVTCPTPPVCPTSEAAQIPVKENTWNSLLANASVIEIKFDQGDKCTVQAPSMLGKGLHYYNIRVLDQAHATYAVVFQTLDEGKTLADLQAYPKDVTSAPSWSHSVGENYVGPGTTSYLAEEFPVGQVYISCIISQPNGILRILDYGPVEIK